MRKSPRLLGLPQVEWKLSSSYVRSMSAAYKVDIEGPTPRVEREAAGAGGGGGGYVSASCGQELLAFRSAGS
jgi:hypothetical protein